MRPGLAFAEFFTLRSPPLAFDAVLLPLREALSAQDVQNAFFLSSPELGEKLVCWLRDGAHADEGLERALWEELTRLATQVDCGELQMAPLVGEIGGAANLRHGSDVSRYLQVDIGYLVAVAERAAKLPSLRRRLRFFTNPTLYCLHGKARFLTTAAGVATGVYQVATAGLTPHLDAVIHRAREGAAFEDLVSVAGAIDAEVSLEEAESYVDELIAEQVLVSELFPKPTGENALTDLPQDLSKVAEAPRPRLRAQIVRSGSTPCLPSAVVDELLHGAELLAELTPADNRIGRFTEAFFARYGDDVVPLVEALDEQYGIGFEASGSAEPLLHGLAFSSPSESSKPFRARETLLLRKLEEAWKGRAAQISLSPADAASIRESDALPLPDSFAVCGALFASSEAAIDKGEYFFRLDRVLGPSSMARLAPFCSANASLCERVMRHLRAEERLQPDATFAEIVHLPDRVEPNVVVRPRLREHEIPYFAHAAADSEHRIPITDLRLSVVGQRLRLTSQRLDCELVPRLTAFDDFLDPRNPPIYRFLGALQSQDTSADLQWSWGALGVAAFLPRVVRGRIILTRARWILATEMVRSIARADDRPRALGHLRQQLGLPRFVELDRAERGVFDLESRFAAETLAQRAGDDGSIALVETLPMPEMLCASGRHGRYIHELTVPFLREKTVRPARPRAPSLAVQRSFLPGSEWLQVNLYCGSALADEVMRRVTAPVIERALSSGAMDRWYFIRYTDPGFHLRLRLHGAPTRLMSEVASQLRSLATPLLDDRQLSGLKLDTYHREVGRYGGAEGMVTAEEISHADSKAVLSILQELSDAELIQARWQVAFIGIDMLLSDLGLRREEKCQVLKLAGEDLARRLKAGENAQAQIARRFQRELPLWRQLLGRELSQVAPIRRAGSILRRRSEELKPHCRALSELERAGHLSRPIVDQAYSYIHMFANRLFASAALAQELVLYEFLNRLHSEYQLNR